jgi:hypothetical protein
MKRTTEAELTTPIVHIRIVIMFGKFTVVAFPVAEFA